MPKRSDDDSVPGWVETGDTDVQIDPSDLLELETDARTPRIDVTKLPGYELGHTAGAKMMLAVLRDELRAQGNTWEFCDEVVRFMAEKAGVKWP